MNLTRKHILAFLVGGLLTAGIAVALVHYQMNQAALAEAESKAVLILERNLATHSYFSHQLKPKVLAALGGKVEDGYFEPAWMSSTYAIREIDNYFQSFIDKHRSPYYYKECAINARSPFNEADQVEKAFIERLNREPQLSKTREVRYLGGHPFLVVMHRGEVMLKNCLLCHSSPQVAPAGMVETYGPTRSFGRSEGEVVSAISIRIPLDDAYRETDVFSIYLSGTLAVLILAFTAFMFLTDRKLFSEPMNKLRRRTALLAREDSEGDRADLDLPGEWNDLARDFNQVLGRLDEERHGLEDRVAERTVELEETAMNLGREMEAREKALLALAASEAKFKTLYQKAPISYMALDGRFVIQEVNQTCEDELGYFREELLGAGFTQYLITPAAEEWGRFFDSFRDVGELMAVELELRKKDGSSILVSLNGKISRDPDGEVNMVHCVFSDITQSRKAEMEKARLESQLRQAQKMEALGTLSGGIAHDFNNILAAILGFSELAWEAGRTGRSNTNELAQIIKAGTRAKELVSRILTFSRKAEVHLKPLDPDNEVKRVAGLLRASLPKMIRVSLELNGMKNLVMADPTQLEQVMLNLGGNASDAMPGGGELIIRTRKETVRGGLCRACEQVFSGDYMIIEVVDTGEGMEPEVLEHMFEPFFTTKEVGKGTGLGLSTVFGVVKGHGGHLDCLSRPGKGTTFKVFLPILDVGAPVLHGAGGETLPDLAGHETVLVVDDEEALREIGSRVLEEYGYRVITASTGEEALEKMSGQAREVDAVLLDLNMPGMGGRTCLARLMAMDPDLKVVLMSGYWSDEEQAEMKAMGASGFVPKPFRLKDLLIMLRRVLEGGADGSGENERPPVIH